METIRFDHSLNLRLPKELKERIAVLAARKQQKITEYCRAKLLISVETEERQTENQRKAS